MQAVINVAFSNCQVYDVPAFDQITVQSGDFIGLHYPASSQDNIIAWIKMNATAVDPVSYGLTISDLSRTQGDMLFDESMPVGFQVSVATEANVVKLPALRACVTSTDGKYQI